MKYIILTLLVSAMPFLKSPDLITGKVVDSSNGSPIQGAVVRWKNDVGSVTTDVNGNFSIKKSQNSKVLEISFVGFQTKEVKIKDDGKAVVVKLKAEAAPLDEVVVTGYGTRKQEAVTGAPNASVTLRGSASVLTQTQNYPQPEFNTEDYDHITENRFLETAANPLSTFSIDVDGASYSNVRRFLQGGQLPPAGAVRVEELINYFHYNYPQPKGDAPFSINTEIADCPWNKENKLVMIGLQGKRIPVDNLPPGNIVFLIDVSGSMQDENKLPLVKSSIKLLIEQLREEDKVSMWYTQVRPDLCFHQQVVHRNKKYATQSTGLKQEVRLLAEPVFNSRTKWRRKILLRRGTTA